MLYVFCSSAIFFNFSVVIKISNKFLTFTEFENKLDNVIYLSATPAEYEKEKSNNRIIEQIIRPTGLLDPLIEVKPSKNQIEDLINKWFN